MPLHNPIEITTANPIENNKGHLVVESICICLSGSTECLDLNLTTFDLDGWYRPVLGLKKPVGQGFAVAELLRRSKLDDSLPNDISYTFVFLFYVGFPLSVDINS